MNETTKKLAKKAGFTSCTPSMQTMLEAFAKLVVEETLKQVSERTYGRDENQWYDDDEKWVRLHFGYGELK